MSAKFLTLVTIELSLVNEDLDTWGIAVDATSIAFGKADRLLPDCSIG
jgi:hypothetical protein